ncbi:MAG TPA: HD-GYP domain-containing protein [Vicinamibacterales bacterium]|nr:HD-GYP domain-containing protein [Vicinamibacterales bacterium]
MNGTSAPPRFVVRTMIATLAVLGFVLSAVFVVVAINVHQRERGTVVEKLETGHRMLTALEERRARELRAQVATLAENPTLKAALDTFNAEATLADAHVRRELIATVDRELEKLALRIVPDVLAVSAPDGSVVAVAGRRAAEWTLDVARSAKRDGFGDSYVTLATGVFKFASAPVIIQNATLGTLHLATALDDRFARELSALSGAGTLIVSGERLLATTAPEMRPALTPAKLTELRTVESIRVADREYAVRLFFIAGDAAVYGIESIDEMTRESLRSALRGLLLIAVGAFLLAAIASGWLALTIARPIDRLSRSLTEMTQSRNFENLLSPTGYTLEIDSLTAAFNSMMRAVNSAESETRSAYVGAIRALALALDARDPYTAGHSERVGAISVAIGREMQLAEEQLEILRLGALLHDIGKIGISDDVLRKPGALSAEEFELIKEHPAMGARILRSVPFLAPHLPIVELHHERPDGKGYPHCLQGEEIPVVARIVHVADAFDAMTSARAYRPAWTSQEALRELWRYAGTQFDAEVVQALAAALRSADFGSQFVDETVSVAAVTRKLAVVGARHA